MSTVRRKVDCPQCAFGDAISLADSRTRSADVMCIRCGYEETEELKRNPTGEGLHWELAIHEGYGVLCNGLPGPVHLLHTKGELLEADRWLREQLATGAMATQSAYLTRWNDDTKSVEALFGDLDKVRF